MLLYYRVKERSMKNKFLMEMRSRGYLNQCTDLDKLEEILQ